MYYMRAPETDKQEKDMTKPPETIELRIDGRRAVVNKEDWTSYCASLRKTD